MGCVNSWVSVEMFCAYLNQANKKIDLQTDPNQVTDMFSELLEHVIDLGYKSDADEVIAAYKANPNSEEAAQFKKDWELATLALEGARVSAQKTMIATGKTTRFDRIPNIDEAIVKTIDNYVAGLASIAPVSIPVKASIDLEPETIPTVQDDQESVNGPGASNEDIPLGDQPVAMLSANAVRDANTRGIVTVIQDMLGESRMHLFGDLMGYMHAKVSEGWIDQQVIQGEVRGMVSAEHSARAIKAGFNNTMVNYYKDRSNGELGVYDKYGSVGKYLFFNANNKPFNINLVSEHEGFKVYSHGNVKKGDLLANGKFESVSFVVADEGEDISSVAELMTKNLKGISAVPFASEPTITGEDYLGLGFTTVPDNLKDVYFASMISGNYEAFMKNFYPPIMIGYKSKYRTGFVVNDTSIVAADQDSARISMHKKTTPRLRIVIDGSGKVAGVKADEKMPYLRSIDFEVIADTITTRGFRRDVKGFAEDVLTFINENPKSTEAQVLASIYYRFFAPTDYKVSYDRDPVNGESSVEKTFRSYRGLVSNNSTNRITKQEYDEWIANGSKEEEAPHLNSNALLDNALSGIITSLSSAVQHESAISINGSIRFTNTKSYDILPKYKASIETYTTIENGDGISETRPDIIGNLKVRPERSGSTNKLRITIPDPRSKDTGDYKKKYLEYVVRINPAVKDKGMLFTIEKFPTTDFLTYTELRQVFKGFGFAPVILSSKFMSEFTSASARLENDENKERAVEQFLISSLLVMEMNKPQGTSEVVKALDGVEVISSSTMNYDPVEMLYKYKDVLEDSLRGIYGVDNRQYAIDHNGNKMAIVTLKNKIADSVSLARKMGESPNSVHRNGLLTGKEPKIKIDGFYSKTGIKVGDVVKSNQEMTIHEQASYQMEQLFLQTASEGKATAAFQFGVISDKTNIPTVKFSSTKDPNYFLPTIAGDSALDKDKLHEGFVNSQRNYWANVGEGIIASWNTVLTSMGSAPLSPDIFVAAEQIKAMNLPYKRISAGADLTKNAILAEGKSDDESINYSIAVIPTHVLNNIAMFNDPVLSKEFVDMNLDLFKRALVKEGYDKVGRPAYAIIKKKFPNAPFLKLTDEKARTAAMDILATAFFYHSNTLGQEMLRMHTGGFIQFKMPKGEPLFKIGKKGINTKEVLAKARSMQKTNVLFNSILMNDNLDNDQKARALVFDEVAGIHSSQFIDQVKRNAGMSSTGQYMRLNGANDKGFFLGQSSKNIVIDDPNVKLQILGKSGLSGQDVYDAVQIGHPLYFIRLGNSLGNAESNFSPKGAAVKDITNAMDDQGYYTFQKKATFDMFSFEALRKGTKELENMLVKANTAIRFNNAMVLVPQVDPHNNKVLRGDFKTTITKDMWLRNGHGLGMVYDSEQDAIVDVQSLIKDIDEGVTTTDRSRATAILEDKLNRGVLTTDKVERTFDNMQQLWEYFGSTTNENSWNQVADVIGNYAGMSSLDPRSDIGLTKATYPLRDAYIEKVGFKSQEKTGSKQILPADAVTNSDIVFGSDTYKGWTEVDNTYHTVILQADHNPDTSHNGSSIASDEGSEIENHIPMITQILSAIIGEGMSVADVVGVYNALGLTSQLYSDQVEEEISQIKKDIAAKTTSKLSETELHKKAVGEYFIKQLRGTVSTMQTPGVIGDLIGNTYKDRMSFDTKQVLPLLVSTSNATFNKNTVRMTFAGGQYIVSPSHDFIKSYKIMGVDGYNREDLNNILYDDKHPLHAVAAQDTQFALQAVTIQDLQSSDKVVVDIVNQPVYGDLVTTMGLTPGAVLTFAKLKRLISEHYTSVPSLASLPLETVVANFVADSVKTRMKGLHASANTLSWTKYHKYENGEKVEIKDTEEYKAFQAIEDLGKTVTPSVPYKNEIIGSVDLNSLVDENANINWALLDQLQTELFTKDKWNLKTRPEKHAGETFTWEHIQNVANSAATMELPEGVDRRQVVLAAVLHDIGKPYRNEDHGYDSADIMNKLFKEDPSFKLVRLAVRHHMLNGKNIADYRRATMEAIREGVDPNAFVDLLMAVKAADISRGRSGDMIDEYSGKPIQTTILEEAANHRKAFEGVISEINQRKPAVPRNLLRYYYFNGNNTPGEPIREIFTREEIEQADAAIDNNFVSAQLDAVDFINRARKTDPGLIKRFEKPLYDLLQEDGWVTEAAEFYMPSMHKSIFMLEDTDSLFDVIGSEQPDYTKLMSMGIIKPGEYQTTIAGKSISLSITDNEDLYRQLNTNFKVVNKIFGPGTKNFEAMTPEQQVVYSEFAKARIAQFNHSYEFFSERIKDKFRTLISNTKNATSLDRAIKDVTGMLKHVSGTSAEGVMWNSILSHLEGSKARLDNNDGKTSLDEKALIRAAFNQKINGSKKTIVDEFYHIKAKKMASGFTTSLEFVTARIPAQGKQSGTVGKIKNFMFSSRNSCYGPLEMLTMTGADYDIDKQNMMTWQFNDDGELIDWKPFVGEDGQMSRKKFNEWATQNNLGTKEATEYFKLAVQNFIVHKIITVFKSPKNAIESNTPVSMDKVKGAKSKPDLTKALKATSIADIIELREHASPYNPADMFKYEKLNMDGKSGIGIFASDLKGYFATYYSTVTSTKDEHDFIAFRSNSGLDSVTMMKMGIDPKAVQYFDLKTGELLAQSSSIANTDRFVGSEDARGMRVSDRAKEGIAKLKTLDIQTILESYTDGTMDPDDQMDIATRVNEDQVSGSLEGEDATANLIYAIKGFAADKERAILQEYMDDINKAKDANVEEQAWEDLSELLSAATDNAKELILGQINATASTSSIISTMVRMGIDLKYALQLVGHSDPDAPLVSVQIGTETYAVRNIRELIRKLDDIGDTQKEGAGFARLTPVLEKMQPTAPKSGATQEQIKKYLANPFRQLYTFAKMGEEFGLVSSLLSINQGLKTSPYDSWKFKNSIESRMSDILGEDFDLEHFIKSERKRNGEIVVTKPGEIIKPNYSKDVIAKFNKKRTGINVPFILSKNAHYFGYYNAMFKSKDLVDVVSSVNKATESIIDRFSDKQSIRRITDSDYKGIQNFIYGVSVEGYMQDKVVTINGKVFDLSIASKPTMLDSDIGGRLEFIQYLPEAVYEASNFGIENHFLNSIPVQDSVVDYVTQVKLPVLKGPNLMNITPERYAELQIGVSTLKRTHRELYDALFLYSLITTKGAFAGGSFMALYGTDKYIGFSEYVQKNASYISSVATNEGNETMIRFNNPVFIEMLSTDADKSKAYLKAKIVRVNENGEEEHGSWTSEDTQTDEALEHMENDGHEGMVDGIDEESFRRKRTFADLSEKLFDLTNVTTGKIRGNIKANLIRSKETGVIYNWDKELQIWIPMVQRVPNAVIPYSATNSSGLISDTGFSIGWDVNLPVSATNTTQKSVKVISFMDTALLKRLREEPRGEAVNSELGIALKIDRNIPLKPNTQYYLVQDEGGKYSILSRDVLMSNSDNNLVLSGPKITRKFSSGREDMELEKKQYFYKKDGVLYDREIPGSEMTSSVILSPSRIASVNSMTGKFFPFNGTIMKEISDSISNTVTMSDADLDRKYENVREAYYKNLLIAFEEDKGAAMEELDSEFNLFTSPFTKLNTLYNAEEMFKKRFGDVEGANTEPPVDGYITNKNAIPSIVRRMLTNKTLLETTSWAQIQELFKHIKIPAERFRTLVSTSVMGKGGKLDVVKGMTQTSVIDGVVTPYKKLIMSDKIIDSVKYSIDHTVPEDMRKEFNRQASPSVLDKLLTVLQDRFPDSSFTMMGTEQIRAEFGDEYAKPGVKAFVNNGTIVFNQERITLDTPVHEYSHIYMQYLKLENKELYHKLVSEALQHPLANHIAKSYPTLNKFELGEEVVVSLIAARVSGQTLDNENLDSIIANTSKGKLLFDKVLQFFKDIFGKAFNINPNKLTFTLSDSVNDIIGQIGDKIAFGKGSILNDFSPQIREVIRKSRKGETMNYQEVLTMLKQRGFIERVCV